MRKLPWMIACFALAACRDNRPQPEQTSTTTVTAATFELGAGEPDFVLTRRVEAAIASDPAVTVAARSVSFEAIDGVVSLEGAVENGDVRDALDRIVRTVPGVTSTLDKVVVAPTRVTDERESEERMAGSLQRTLAYDPALRNDRDKITVDLKQGTVTLRGTISTPAARSHAVEAVSATPGVLLVNDLLKVPNE